MIGKKTIKPLARILPLLTLFIIGLAGSGLALGFKGGFCEAWGPLFTPMPYGCEVVERYGPPSGENPTARILYWNEVMLTANAVDSTPVLTGETRIFGEQLGPHRTSRAFAIVQIAVFDAVNAVYRRYESYTGIDPVYLIPKSGSALSMHISVDTAIAQAAHDTLAALYPSQTPTFDSLLAEDLGRIPDGQAKEKGIALGKKAAEAILALRADDGSGYEEPVVGVDYYPGIEPGEWRPDPVSMVPLALGAYWGEVTPFVTNSTSQYRVPPPPSLRSLYYAAAFKEVKLLGGDGITTPTIRTPDQTIKGIYWGYDNVPCIGSPPRLYNQIAKHIADKMRTQSVDLARLLALVNVTMADASIGCWEAKYKYAFWRPVTGIREADRGTGPTGLGDGNLLTIADPDFVPLGAQAGNTDGVDFTPPFPAYPSGHAALGSALFQTLRNFYGTDKIPFTFVSDEYNGVTRDNDGNVRPLIPRKFSSLSQAELENGQSRIYLGLHWAFDKTQGIAHGRSIANYIYKKSFRPLYWPRS